MKKKFWLTALLAVALLCGAALADTYFCSNCAKTQNFEVQSETYINDDYHETVWICEICGDPYKMNADHYGGTATCTQKAVCDGCKGEYGDLAPHSFTTKASGQLASAATCTEAAKYYAQCDNCGAVSDMVTVSVGDPAGHKWLWASFYDGTHQRPAPSAAREPSARRTPCRKAWAWPAWRKGRSARSAAMILTAASVTTGRATATERTAARAATWRQKAAPAARRPANTVPSARSAAGNMERLSRTRKSSTRRSRRRVPKPA